MRTHLLGDWHLPFCTPHRHPGGDSLRFRLKHNPAQSTDSSAALVGFARRGKGKSLQVRCCGFRLSHTTLQQNWTTSTVGAAGALDRMPQTSYHEHAFAKQASHLLTPTLFALNARGMPPIPAIHFFRQECASPSKI